MAVTASLVGLWQLFGHQRVIQKLCCGRRSVWWCVILVVAIVTVKNTSTRVLVFCCSIPVQSRLLERGSLVSLLIKFGDSRFWKVFFALEIRTLMSLPTIRLWLYICLNFWVRATLQLKSLFVNRTTVLIRVWWLLSSAFGSTYSLWITTIAIHWVTIVIKLGFCTVSQPLHLLKVVVQHSFWRFLLKYQGWVPTAILSVCNKITQIVVIRLSVNKCSWTVCNWLCDHLIEQKERLEKLV